jgi:hypothetical protein
MSASDDAIGGDVRAAGESAKGPVERLLAALEHGTPADVALAAEKAYLLVGRLAALARAETPRA